MAEPSPVVFVLDDDASMRVAIERLLRSANLSVRCFSSASEFLNSARVDAPACLVLDVRLPDANGLELQRQLADRGVPLPIVFISGHGDIPMTVRAIKAGAVEFLPKPFRDQDLLAAVDQALAGSRAALQLRAELAELQARFDSLTPREREVMKFVVTGRLNKQIAQQLGIAEVTTKIHRGRVMHKMQAQSVAELVRMAARLGSGRT